jgi:S1/P1 Nuclease
MPSQNACTALYRSLRSTVLPCLVALPLVFPQDICAWGNTGHEAVAYVAWQQLTPAVQKRVMELLMLVPTLQNPNKPPKPHQSASIPGYKDWVAALPAGLSQDQQQLYLFMRAATWADSIKHEWLMDSDTPPARLKTEVNIGFTDTASHGYWHFIDAAFASDDSTPPPTPVPNVATQIVALRAAIASSEPDLLKSYDLVWLEHLVGDIHQPLHGAVRYYANKGDEGGNTVKIKAPLAMEKQFEGTLSKDPPRELHAFWDDLPGEGQPAPALPFAATFAKALAPAAKRSVTDANPADWGAESLVLAKKDAYKMPPIGAGPKPESGSSYAITQDYYDAAMQDAKDRIALAGARLAKLLNENLQ